MQCQKLTNSGKQCSRKTTNIYCWQHQTNKVTSPKKLVSSPRLPPILLQKFPLSDYKIQKITDNDYFINSQCGLACDDPGGHYDAKGNLLYSNPAPQIPINNFNFKK